MLRKHLRSLVLVAVVTVPLSLAVPASARSILAESSLPAASGADAALIQAAASRYGLNSGQLQIATRSQVSLPLTVGSVNRAKVIDVSSGRLYGVSLDSSGRAVDYISAREAELAAYHSRFGTMSGELVDVVGKSRASAAIPVAFWLKADVTAGVTRDAIQPGVTRAQVEAVENANMARMADAAGAANRDFIGTLRAAGHKVTSAAKYSPAVFALVAAKDVKALSRDSRVLATSYAGNRVYDAQNIVKVTTAATKVWNLGITGADPAAAPGTANVGVVECCDSLFEENKADLDAENNYYLARINEGRAAACGGDHSHPTAVSGIIGSTHPSITGIGYNANIYFNSSCNGSESELVNVVQDVSAKVSGPTNHSYGATPATPCPGVTFLATLQRTLDNLVRGGADSQYVAAGNSGNAACVGTPATAWNVVSVGAFDDRNTSGWADDVMAGFSSGADPDSDSGDREEPDLAAPGVNFTGLLPSAGGGPTGNIGSGTSYATPAMVGGAALAGQRQPFLFGFPETEKAVLMAAACHNIQGGQTKVGSELDGAGGPDFQEMYNLVNTNRFRGDTVANGSGVAITQTFPSVVSGQELRAAIAWDSNTSYSLYATDPSDDLDLILRRPNGTVAAVSSSFDNTDEVVEFVADASGTWTIELTRFRTSDPSGFTFAGMAWHRYAPSACTAP